MTIYTTTFAGQTTGANSTNFTNRYDAETAVSVENPAIGEEDDRVLQFGTGDIGDVYQSFDDVDGDANRDNIEVLCRYQIAADVNRQSIIRVRASGSSGGTKTAYDAYVNGDDFTLVRWVGGSGTLLTSTPTETTGPYADALGDAFANEPIDRWIWCRFRVNGTGATVTLQAKWWLDGWKEPSGWTLEYSDTSASRITAAGWVGFAKRLFSGNTYLDYFSAGTNGDSVAAVFGDQDTRVTQSTAEVLYDPEPAARITQVNASAMHSGDPMMRITQVNASVMYSVPAVGADSQTVLCIINT